MLPIIIFGQMNRRMKLVVKLLSMREKSTHQRLRPMNNESCRYCLGCSLMRLSLRKKEKLKLMLAFVKNRMRRQKNMKSSFRFRSQTLEQVSKKRIKTSYSIYLDLYKMVNRSIKMVQDLDLLFLKESFINLVEKSPSILSLMKVQLSRTLSNWKKQILKNFRWSKKKISFSIDGNQTNKTISKMLILDIDNFLNFHMLVATKALKFKFHNQFLRVKF